MQGTFLFRIVVNIYWHNQFFNQQTISMVWLFWTNRFKRSHWENHFWRLWRVSLCCPSWNLSHRQGEVFSITITITTITSITITIKITITTITWSKDMRPRLRPEKRPDRQRRKARKMKFTLKPQSLLLSLLLLSTKEGRWTFTHIGHGGAALIWIETAGSRPWWRKVPLTRRQT